VTAAVGPAGADLVATVAGIADDTAAVHAADVDERARFPSETFEALRSAGSLAALVPVEWGGAGADLLTIARAVTVLGRRCGSSALIFAMHHSQVASLVGHAQDPSVERTLRAIAESGLLVGSATTEAGVGGDVRTSSCHIQRQGSRFRLVKQAPVISYGEHADVILATARRDESSAPGEQVLAVCRRNEVKLEQTSAWDALGLRGTCSNGYLLTAEGDLDAILTTPYAQISAQTMLPVSHLLWASAWLGLAEEAVDRSRRFVQEAARARPGTEPPGALRLAGALALLHQLRMLISAGLARYAELSPRPADLSRPGVVIEFNTIKVSASTLLVQIVHEAMTICGLAGYRNDGQYSLGLILRDAYGSGVMVNNDRISRNNAGLALVAKSV
jgi:acyl-CoA dehydrogenase